MAVMRIVTKISNPKFQVFAFRWQVELSRVNISVLGVVGG